MSFHRVVVQQADGTNEAIVDFINLTYTLTFNNPSTFQVTLPATLEYDFSKFDVYDASGANDSGVIFIYRNGTLKLKGKILKTKIDSQGNYVLLGQGWEIFLAETNTGKNKTFISQNIATTRTSLIGDIAEISVGTNEAFSGDPLGALDLSDKSYMRAIHEVTVENANQDWSMDYANDEIDFEDHKGSSTTVITLVQGIDISSVLREKDTENLFNRITVIGSGVGAERIEVTVNDATSQTTYGIREPPYSFIFKNLTNDTTATDVANKILDQMKDPIEKISANVKDVDIRNSSNGEIVTGDVVTIRDSKANINTTMRILEETRIVIKDTEQLSYTFIPTGKRTHPNLISKQLGNVANSFSNVEAYPWKQVTTEKLVANTAGLSTVNPVFMYGFELDTDGIITVPENTAPGTPGSGKGFIYEKTDGILYFKNDAGTEYDLTTAGSGLWESVGGDDIRPTTANADLIPNTSGDLGQTASPTWNNLYVDMFSITSSGTTTTMDIGPNASDTTLTLTNSGAGSLTIFNAVAAVGSFAKININGSSTKELYVVGDTEITQDLTVDTNTLHVDSANNEVGIGTISPRSELDVVGLLAITGVAGHPAPSAGKGLEFAYDTTPDYGNFFCYDRTASAYKRLNIDGLTLYLNSGSNGGIFFGTGAITAASSALSVASIGVNGSGSETLYVAGTAQITSDVGIGTTPATSFHIKRASGSARCRVENTGASANAILDLIRGSTQAEIGVYGGDSDKMKFYQGGAFRMTIETSGDVGIGTTSPGSLLDVNGTGSFNQVDINVSGTKALNVSGDIDFTGNLFSNGTQGILFGDIRTGNVTENHLAEALDSQTTTSSSFVDLPTMTQTFTSEGDRRLLIIFSGEFSNDTAGGTTEIVLSVAGVEDSDSRRMGISNSASDPYVLSTNTIVTIASGSQTVKIRWRKSSGTTSAVTHRSLSILELKR